MINFLDKGKSRALCFNSVLDEVVCLDFVYHNCAITKFLNLVRHFIVTVWYRMFFHVAFLWIRYLQWIIITKHSQK